MMKNCSFWSLFNSLCRLHGLFSFIDVKFKWIVDHCLKKFLLVFAAILKQENRPPRPPNKDFTLAGYVT